MQWRVLFVEADDRRSPKPSETGCSESRKFFENSHREKFCRAVTGAWLGRTQTLESVGEKPSSSENADYHTYFVGSESWGFSVWAHNASYMVYVLKDGGGTIRYVGTAKNQLALNKRRSMHHSDAKQAKPYWTTQEVVAIVTGKNEKAARRAARNIEGSALKYLWDATAKPFAGTKRDKILNKVREYARGPEGFVHGYHDPKDTSRPILAKKLVESHLLALQRGLRVHR
jgi:hypothetical protein